jgi:hypothetical protein
MIAWDRDLSVCEDVPMLRLLRLVTLADVAEDAEARRISVSLRHEAVLEDGRRILLLDDRGWSETLGGARANEVADIWALMSEEHIAETARVVVGPDEPFDGRSQGDMENDHWNVLVESLRTHGVVVDARELKQLPHDVVLSEPLLARLGRRSGNAS